jgi:hypothetical protein
MARGRLTSAATRLVKLEERLAEARRACAGEAGPVIAYGDDDENTLKQYVAQRERMGAELVVVCGASRSAPRVSRRRGRDRRDTYPA